MKCICCEQEIKDAILNEEDQNGNQLFEGYCCGYTQDESRQQVSFRENFKSFGLSTFLISMNGKECSISPPPKKGISRLQTASATTPAAIAMPELIEGIIFWTHGFDFKDKEKSIERIERMLVFK